MSGDTPDLAATLDYSFSNPDLLNLALTHSSLAKSRAERNKTNQRLEFLGDRVLGLVIAEMIYEAFPNEEEGAMARRHTALVRKETLARVANLLDLGQHVRLAPSEIEGGGRTNEALLADTCEALIAALYLDGGMAAADTFIRRYWTTMMDEDMKPPKDAKTSLQEFAQSRAMPLPVYREVSRTGPPHAPVFTIEVNIENGEMASGTGGSKRLAEQMAAETLLKQLGVMEEETDQ